jgi:hypothetical protein
MYELKRTEIQIVSGGEESAQYTTGYEIGKVAHIALRYNGIGVFIYLFLSE